jgi:hypothetical protein
MGDAAQRDGSERSACLGSPADKVDHLKAVSSGEDRIGPAGARYDLSIVFDGDAVSLKPERCDKVVEACRLLQLGESARLAIENEC